MASNVISPDLLPIVGHHISESIPKLGKSLVAHLAYTRQGNFPAADGGFAAGVNFMDSPAAVSTASLTINPSYAIMRVKPANALALDGPVAVAATGEAIPATGTNYVFGRVVDGISDGTGTAEKPHYVLIKLV